MKGNETILITTVLSFTNSLSRTTFIFSLKTSFVYSNLFSLAKTVTIRCHIQTSKLVRSPSSACKRRSQLLKITIHQLFHYCRLRQCYRVPFRLVIYRSFSSDFDGFSYLPNDSVTVVNPSHIHHIVWDFSKNWFRQRFALPLKKHSPTDNRLEKKILRSKNL